MPLLVGEPGSGKTTRILNEVRRRLGAGEGSFRLVVPTSTMAEHLRNLLAREGYLVRPASIATIAGFTRELLPDVEVASPLALELLTRQVLQERSPACFAPMASSPGLAPALAGALEELANAGCDSLQWAALAGLGIPASALTRGLGEVYERLEEKLREQKLVLRTTQLAEAARRVRQMERGGVAEALLFDGFFSFSRGELQLLKALHAVSRLTISLPAWQGAAASIQEMKAMGLREERLGVVRPVPEERAIAALTREHEVEEIALQLLEARAAGRRWRECGIVLRSAEPYLPLVTTTLARLGIPMRSYFAPPLAAHPVSGFFEKLLAALESGWEWQATTQVLRHPVTEAGRDPRTARLEGQMRAALPGSGLEGLKELAQGLEPALDLLGRLEALTAWRDETARPAEWAGRLSGLAGWLARPEPAQQGGAEELAAMRLRAAAARAWQTALVETASLLGDEPTLLSGFWAEARSALSSATLRVEPPARDAVHVMDVHEARQWELPQVFLCGLVEGEFPRSRRPDPVLSDDLRFRLRQQGIAVNTRAEFEANEEFLFRIALTRATARLTFSWPTHDAEGRPTLRTFHLDERDLKPEAARRLRLRPVVSPEPATAEPLTEPAQLAWMKEKHQRHRPTSLEVFLQCPFQFFGRRTLGLEPLPALPAERLDLLAQGSLAHDTVEAWHRGEGVLEQLFEEHWRRLLAEKRIPLTHRAEIVRLGIVRSLRFYEREESLRPQPGVKVELEYPLEVAVAGSKVSGRADRVDLGQAARVYEFKYSSANSLKRRAEKLEAGLIVQGGLYLAALREKGLAPEGLYYIGLRGETTVYPYVDPAKLEEIMEGALEAAAASITRIYAGDITVQPADRDACQYCELSDACRVRAAERAAAAGE